MVGYFVRVHLLIVMEAYQKYRKEYTPYAYSSMDFYTVDTPM